MDIKLKKINSYILKYIALLGIFISLAYLLKTIHSIQYLSHIAYKIGDGMVSIKKYYIFGKVVDIRASYLIDDYIILAIVFVVINIICFVLFYQNRKSSRKLENIINKISSKLYFEILILFIGLIIVIRSNYYTKYYTPYTLLTYVDAIILFLGYILIQYLIFNKSKLEDKSIIYKLIKDLISKHNKKTLNRKIATIFALAICLNILALFIVNLVFFRGFTRTMDLTIALINTLPLILILAYIYIILAKKFVYMEYISKNIKKIEEGDLKFKLKVEGKDEISHLASSINNITNGLDVALENQIKSEKMKTELITNVSHDLKTPLTSIVNYVDILKNNELDKDTMKDYISILDRKSQRLKALVEDIFEASKISSGDIELNIEKTDIKELLIQSVVELEDKIEKSNLDFVIDTPGINVYTNIDGKRIYRVFENLINNILKYSLQNTRVYIDMLVEDGEINIILKNISNHRLNMKPEELLERFRRGDVARNTEGSGLGLSIAQNLVNLNGGTMDLYIDGDLFKVHLKFNGC